MSKKKKDYSIIFWLHLLVNVILYCSWFLFSWYWILLGEALVQLQFHLFKGCIFTRLEFGGDSTDESCIAYYFEKWGILKNTSKTRLFIKDISPRLVFILMIVWQVLLGMEPLLF